MTEEDLAEKKRQEENKKIEENFDQYAELDATAEEEKIKNSTLSKKYKKAVSRSFDFDTNLIFASIGSSLA